MRNFLPSQKDIYHIFNRGTDKRPIFLTEKDYERFVVNCILFNTEAEAFSNIRRYDINSANKKMPENPLVYIHAFCLLPNHFHFILEQCADNGIAKFMHKIEMGYSKYFNKQNSRSGNLFQGNYKIVIPTDDAHLNHLPVYLHLNPLDLLPNERSWEENGVQNKKIAWEFLTNYKWSSLQEYIGARNLPFVKRDFFDSVYKSPSEWEKAITEWLPKKNTEMFDTEC